MNSICPRDDQLLAVATDEAGSEELREHIDHCVECQKRVKMFSGEVAELRSFSQAGATATNHTIISGVASSPLPITSTIGRYVVIANLGSGGQADVYRVVDPNLGRQMVLKLSHRQSRSDTERRDALLAEGQLLADLDHPGLIRIFDVGIYDGRPYLVLEHVPGGNLEQTFADRKPTVREAAQVISEIAQVVAYAHRRGVVHGDLTPRNILIDAHGRARLIDFGLSKIEDAWGEKAGLPGGTPEFLPPESALADGRLGRAGPAGDVFGLGATLFWLLTGRPPFAASTISESLERARACDIDFDPLRWARVPNRVARICQLAMAADPADRPSAQVVADVLQRAARRWTTPRLVVAIAAIALIGAGSYLWLRESRITGSPLGADVIHSTPTINVFGHDGVRTLSNELPLRTGDRLAVFCNISRGHDAIMLWFNAQGELKSFSPVRDVNDNIDRLVYPAPHRSFSLGAPEGTEMFFFCRGEPVAEEILQSCFPIGAVNPQIPPHNWLTLQRSAVKIEGPLKSEIPDGIVKIEGVLKDINRKLKQHFISVTGIAFPHDVADGAEAGDHWVE